MIIRKAVIEDLPQMTEIYNHAILNTTAHFYIEPKTIEERLIWFNEHEEMHPIHVADYNGKVIGWASLSRWSVYHAFKETVESSVYIDSGHKGNGLGYRLLKSVIEEGEKAGIHSVIARILEGNPASIRIHEKLGFEQVGVFKEIGKKFGRYLDLHLMQKMCV